MSLKNFGAGFEFSKKLLFKYYWRKMFRAFLLKKTTETVNLSGELISELFSF